MKTLFLSIALLASISTTWAQSISLNSGNLILPQLASNPPITVGDNGKMIYNTTLGKVMYCDGTTWVELSATTPTPSFSGQILTPFTVTSTQTAAALFQNYEAGGDNFLPLTAPVNPSSFVAPYNGIYQFNFKGITNLTNFVAAVNTRIKITIKTTYNQGSNSQVFYFPITSISNGSSISGYVNAVVLTGGVVNILHEIVDPQTGGTVSISDFYFQGGLITKN